MAFELEWVYNISTNSFVAGIADGTPINPPSLVSGDTPTILVTFVKNSRAGGIEVVTSATAVRIAIGPIGGAVATSATATGPNSDNAYTISLPMGVAGITTLLNGSSRVQTDIEFKIGSPFTSYQSRVSVNGLLDAGATSPTPPADVSLGTNQALGMFQLRDDSSNGNTNPTQRISRSSGPLGKLFLETMDDSGQWHAELVS
jgi:hypothetical protein